MDIKINQDYFRHEKCLDISDYLECRGFVNLQNKTRRKTANSYLWWQAYGQMKRFVVLFTLLASSKEIKISLVMPRCAKTKFPKTKKKMSEIMCHSVTVTPVLEIDDIFVPGRQ